jgi:hypothetical protein
MAELIKRRSAFVVQGMEYYAYQTIEEYASQHSEYFFHREHITNEP